MRCSSQKGCPTPRDVSPVMPKLLIVSDLFPPQFAPRIAYIVRYLCREGWDVEVVTEEIESPLQSSAHGKVFSDCLPPCPIHSLPLRKRYGTLASLWQTLSKQKNRRMMRAIEKRVKVAQFDGIMGFTYRTFPLEIVARLGRKYHKPIWMDCRDIVEEYSRYDFLPRPLWGGGSWTHPLMELLQRWFICQRTRALRQADLISTVSSWHQSVLQSLHPQKRVHCLLNGYDETLFIPTPYPQKGEKITLLFTGRLLSLSMRDPSLLFEALAAPSLQSWVESEALEIHWYTDPQSKQTLQQLLASYPPCVGRLQKFFSMVPFEQVPALLGNASAILLLGNKETPHGPHGMVSTKLFEAMAMRRPILLVRSDEALVEQALQEYGDATAAREVDQVEEFLLRLIRRHLSPEGIVCTAPLNHAEPFSRCHMAQEIVQLWQELLQERRA